LDEITTTSKVVFKDVQLNMAVRVGTLGDPTGETAEYNHTVKQTADSSMLTLQLQATQLDL